MSPPKIKPVQPPQGMRTILTACLVSLLVVQGLPAQDKHPFSAGLKQLGDLGMPDMKGAEWMKRPGSNEQDEYSELSYALQEIKVKLKGNSWKLSTTPPSYIGFASSSLIEVEESNTGDAEQGEEAAAGGSLRDRIRAYASKNAPKEENPEPPDERSLAQKDADLIISRLRKESVANQINESLEWGGGYQQQLIGSILLFAVQIHRSGDEATANRLAEALFQAIDNDAIVIDSAINQLADAEYEAVSARFYENGDWQAFLTDLKALLKKYPRGWRMRPAVDMLAARVAHNDKNPPLPKVIDGITIDPKAYALVTRLVEKPKEDTSDDAVLRLAEQYGLDPEELTDDQRQALVRALMMGAGGESGGGEAWLLTPVQADETKPVMDQIKALGMAALPALAAAVEDETLTFHQNYGSRSYGGYSNEDAESMYRSMNRPTTRGELASRLLESVIAIESEPYQSVDTSPLMLRELALELWRNHRNSTPIQIASMYLQEGQYELKQVAAQFLTESKDAAAHQAFEEAALKARDPINMLPFVEQYLSQQKQKAKPFATAFIAILRKGNYDQETLQRTAMGHLIQRAGGIDKYIDTLLLKIGDISLTKLIDQALRESAKPDEDDEDRESPIMALANSISQVELNECMVLFGKVADRATPEQWEEILAVLLSRASDAVDTSDGAVTPPSQLAPETLEMWAELCKRDTPLSAKSRQLSYMRLLGCQTAGDVAIFLVDTAADDGNISYVYQVSRLYDDASQVIHFSRERVDAILKGETPKPWPDREAVSEKRSEEILEKLGELPAKELLAYASSLDMNEKLVVLEFTSMYYNDEPSKNVIELNRSIITLDPVYRINHDPEFTKSLGVAVGDRVDGDLILRIADRLLADPELYSPSTVLITRGPLQLGSTIQASTPALKERDLNSDYSLRNIAMIMDQIKDHDAIVTIQCGRNAWARAKVDGKSDWVDLDIFGRSEERPKLADVLAEDQTMIQPIMIVLMTRDQAKALTKDFNSH